MKAYWYASVVAMCCSTIPVASAHPVEGKPVFLPAMTQAVPEDGEPQIVLKNDMFNDTAGGQAYLEQGFVTGEKAGVWVAVPADIPLFKPDYFRVMMGGGAGNQAVTVYFSAGNAPAGGYTTALGAVVQNAAQIQTQATPNTMTDIELTGAEGQKMPCVKAGDLVVAGLEFTHDGAPSIYRDLGPIANPKANVLCANPGGCQYSEAFGLQGNWILRIVGHKAKPSEC